MTPAQLSALMGQLAASIAAVCPIDPDTLAIGDPADRSTWRYTPTAAATSAQIDAAQQAVAGFSFVQAPTVTGNQWTFALKDLGLGGAWRAARAKSKSDDQSRIELIARDTQLLATDPLLIRVAANAGTTDGTSSGPPVIDVPTVYAHAQGMPL